MFQGFHWAKWVFNMISNDWLCNISAFFQFQIFRKNVKLNAWLMIVYFVQETMEII